MYTKETHIALPQEFPVRLQEYGTGIFKTLPTKSALKKALKKELILVDGKIGATGTYIKGGEHIELKEIPKTQKSRKFVLDLEVVHEDDYLAVIHKPPGIEVSGNSFKTIANALGQNLKMSNQTDAVFPQPVHRLDYATTGLLLIGKTSSVIMALNRLFENKEINKIYVAITIGKMSKKGIIDFPIDGKVAVSEYEILQTVLSKRFGFLNLVRLHSKTGRRHQLRKHLLAIGNPILGDISYNMPNLILKGKGLYLDAIYLEFMHPVSKKQIRVEKNIPKKFLKIFKEIASYDILDKKSPATDESATGLNN